MRTFFTMLALFVMAMSQGQAIKGLQVVGPSDPAYSSVMKHITTAQMVIIGANLPNNADDYTTEVNRLVAEAKPLLQKGKIVMVRHRLTPNMSSTSWKNLASGQPIDAIYYPPAGNNKQLWARCGVHLKRQAEALAALCDSLAIPRTRVVFNLGNEAAPGGVCGPYLQPYSSGKPLVVAALQAWKDYTSNMIDYATFKTAWLKIFPIWTIDANGRPLLEGQLPERFFDMRNTIRNQVPFNSLGIPVIAYTFETAGDLSTVGTPGYNELQSWKGTNAETYANNCSEIDFNSYNSNPYRSIYEDANGDGKKEWVKRNLTPDEMAALFATKVAKNVAAFKAYPLFALKKYGITETNFALTSAVPGATQAEKEYNVFLYRQAHYKVCATLPDIVRFGVFTSLASDATTVDNPLWRYTNGVLSPIGGELFP